MCARIFLPVTDEELAEFLEVADAPAFAPRYNIAPGQDVLVARLGEAGRCASLMRWGFVPPWTVAGGRISPFVNARSENAPRNVTFRDSFRLRRCVIPA